MKTLKPVFTNLLFAGSLLLAGPRALGFDSGRIGLGTNQIFVGMFNKVTTQNTGKNDFLGTHHMFPITLNYQTQSVSDWFWAPSLTYSLLPRKTEDGSIEESLLIIGSPFGQNFSQNWDWFAGPGIYRYTVKGKGGSYTDPSNNSFYYPDSSSTSQLVYLSGGIGNTMGDFRLALEALCLGCMSSQKRTFALSLLFSYQGWSL